jgi:hypothetical protein
VILKLKNIKGREEDSEWVYLLRGAFLKKAAEKWSSHQRRK